MQYTVQNSSISKSVSKEEPNIATDVTSQATSIHLFDYINFNHKQKSVDPNLCPSKKLFLGSFFVEKIIF